MSTIIKHIPRGIEVRQSHEPIPIPPGPYIHPLNRGDEVKSIEQRPRARCMGGRFCTHGPGQCTADPEYQKQMGETRDGGHGDDR